METEKLMIGGIPAVVWGKPSEKAYVYVHGKQSCKEFAEGFAQAAEAKGYQTLSFDLPEHGERKGEPARCDVWNGVRDLSTIADSAFSRWAELSLFACSIGAYFSLNAYADRPFEKALFQSPILDMEHLIGQMFLWFGVSEERLRAEGEIPTPIEPLSWEYYQYAKAHRAADWRTPTAILYGGLDNLQPLSVIQAFTAAHGCRLTVSACSEHPFMAPADAPVVQKWFDETI